MGKIILEMKNITKMFPGVKALDQVNLQVQEGEIHAICGENGAGKSTLMKVLSGLHPTGTYTGSIEFEGKTCHFNTIKESEKLGIVIIHQELAMVSSLSIGENMFLGNERGSKAHIDWDETYGKANEYLKLVGLHESSHTLVKDLGLGKQQLVEIAKALAKNVKLLILDEPTSSLNEDDSKHLLDMLIAFKKKGMTSILISHKLNEIAYCADKVTIIRDGATITTLTKEEGFDENKIIKAMVGREITNRFPLRVPDIGKTVLEVKNWSLFHPDFEGIQVVKNVSFHVNAGEIVGISGLMGAGRTELAMSIFGRSYGRNITGELIINGKKVIVHNAKEAIEHGLAYVTEDRKENGLVLPMSIKMNTTLSRMEKVCSKGITIDTDLEVQCAKDMIAEMGTKCPSEEQKVSNLSGGNQQKVLIGKWLFAEPDILFLDEPTRGIDVGAKYEIYTLMNKMVNKGKAVVMISSEMPELLGMADRIYVMNEGQMVGELSKKEASQEKIMSMILQSEKKESK